MIDLVVPAFITPILALSFAFAFPASLYLWGFWQFQHRDDVRVICRNFCSVILVVLSCYSVLWLIIDPFPTLQQSPTFSNTFFSRVYMRFALFYNYTGFNLANLFFSNNPSWLSSICAILWVEVQSILLGLLVVNSLFLGQLAQNLISWAIPRNQARVALLAQKHLTQQRNNTATNTPAPLPTPPTHPTYPQSPIHSVILYELSHWSDSITNLEIKHEPPIHYIKAVLKRTLKEFQISYQYFISSCCITTSSDVGQIVEYESVSNFRSIIISPIVEEMVYRSALYPLLLSQTSNNLTTTIFISALLFASSHLHHFFRKQAQHGTIPALLQTTVQWAYCFLFALFCGYLYSLPLIRTTSATAEQILNHTIPMQPLFSLTSAIICHIICNLYGLPSTDFNSPYYSKLSMIAITLYGLFQFFFLLTFLPSL